MSDLIRRLDAIEAIRSDIKELDSFDIDYGIKKASIRRAEWRISQVQQVDAVEVVRCKDCCYWDRKTIRHNCNDFICWNEAVCEEHSIGGNEQHEMWTDADWFCAGGERKEQNDE